MALPLGAALAVFLATGAAPDATGPTAAAVHQQLVTLVSPQALHMMMVSQRVALIDVREPSEFSAGHIDGAVLMPLSTLNAEYTKLPKDVSLVVYCRSGVRSAKAVAFLLAHGYGRAVSLDGGYLAYSASAH
jgi:rhodanese-related sulfurtransferase